MSYSFDQNTLSQWAYILVIVIIAITGTFNIKVLVHYTVNITHFHISFLVKCMLSQIKKIIPWNVLLENQKLKYQWPEIHMISVTVEDKLTPRVLCIKTLTVNNNKTWKVFENHQIDIDIFLGAEVQ